jgi:hypothetical protein
MPVFVEGKRTSSWKFISTRLVQPSLKLRNLSCGDHIHTLQRGWHYERPRTFAHGFTKSMNLEVVAPAYWSQCRTLANKSASIVY